MANFKESFDKVILAEGGYTNDKDDSGGETYLGITRVHEPKSKMWAYVDEIKKQLGYDKLTNTTSAVNKIMTRELGKNPLLVEEARKIYKTNYWDKVRGDEINDQGIAHQIFDHAVNAGISAGIKVGERAVDLPVTGKISKLLIETLNKQL